MLLVVAADGYTIYFAKRVTPRVSVGPLKIGSMRLEDAKKQVAEKIKQNADTEIIVKVGDKKYSVKPVDINFVIDSNQSVDRAFDIGHSGVNINSVREAVSALIYGRRAEFVYMVGQEKLDAFVDNIAKEVDQPEENANITVKAGKIEASEGENGLRINKNVAKKEILARMLELSTQTVVLYKEAVAPVVAKYDGSKDTEIKNIVSFDLKIQADDKSVTIKKKTLETFITGKIDNGQLLPAINSDKVRAYLDSVSDSLEAQPVNAKIKIDNGQVSVLSDGNPGKIIDQGDAVKKIAEALLARTLEPNKHNEVAVRVKKVEADVSADTIGKLNIKGLIGKATTSLAGSPKNRIHNIQTGVAFLSGIVVSPGDEFSTIKSLGRVDGSTGYLPELVIKENATVPEFGGGLCQVSTTLFRAILNSGLPITERASHKYRVSYYEAGVGPGLDATIYSPKPDLKFKNDTGNYILIQGYVEGNNITFEFYGTSDGRSTKIEGPHILSTTPAPAAQYINTDTLPKGETKQTEKAHSGATTTATYIVTRDGKEINRQTFNSAYKPWPARYLVGTAEPAPEAAPAGQ